jgi:urease gamma subunit
MELRELKSLLRAHPTSQPRLVLPGGDQVPAHFHITEVGHVAKRFIDCGGKLHDTTETCLLQTYVADDVDHRLDGETFAKILDLGQQVLPHDAVDVEVEYEDCDVSQYPIATAEVDGETILLKLSSKHTDCLAKEQCGIDGTGCGSNDDATANAPLAASAACC